MHHKNRTSKTKMASTREPRVIMRILVLSLVLTTSLARCRSPPRRGDIDYDTDMDRNINNDIDTTINNDIDTTIHNDIDTTIHNDIDTTIHNDIDTTYNNNIDTTINNNIDTEIHNTDNIHYNEINHNNNIDINNNHINTELTHNIFNDHYHLYGHPQKSLGCQPGWTMFNETWAPMACFMTRKTTRLEWKEAEHDCVRHGGSLAMPKDANTNRFMVEHMHGNHIWIGLNDKEDDKQFLWSDGEALKGWTNWGKGQPDNMREFKTTSWFKRGLFKGEDCVTMKGDGRWYDEDCTHHARHYMCQAPPVWM